MASLYSASIAQGADPIRALARCCKDRAMNQSLSPPEPADRPHAWLVGGGIASMAAAAFLIRDGDMHGCDITILEESDRLGGVRGGRLCPARRADAGKQISVHIRPLRLDPDAGRQVHRIAGNHRLEPHHPNLVKGAAGARRNRRNQPQVRPQRKADPQHRTFGARARTPAD